MKPLYELADSFLVDASKLEDLELDEQTLKDTLEAMSFDIELKATSIAAFIKNLEASADAIKKAEEQMAARRKAIQSRAEKVAEYLKFNMERTGITSIDCPHFSVKVKKNPESVVIDAGTQIPEEMMRYKPAPPPEPDKVKIKEYLKAHADCTWAHLESGTRLEIK